MQNPGEVLESVRTKKGREIVLRAPNYDDFHGLYEFINSLVDEDTYILLDKRVTLAEELDYVYTLITGITSGRKIHILAEHKGQIVGACGVDRQPGRGSHVGKMGIAVKNGFRGEGIGSALMEFALTLARDAKIKVVFMNVISENKDALRFYEKFGFRTTGIIEGGSAYRGKYVDDLIMTLQLF